MLYKLTVMMLQLSLVWTSLRLLLKQGDKVKINRTQINPHFLYQLSTLRLSYPELPGDNYSKIDSDSSHKIIMTRTNQSSTYSELYFYDVKSHGNFWQVFVSLSDYQAQINYSTFVIYYSPEHA
jgi:hypothetical protein